MRIKADKLALPANLASLCTEDFEVNLLPLRSLNVQVQILNYVPGLSEYLTILKEDIGNVPKVFLRFSQA
jgi:hypothetical protein